MGASRGQGQDHDAMAKRSTENMTRVNQPIFLAMLAVLVTMGLAGGKGWCQSPPPPPYLGDGDLNGDARMDEIDLSKFIVYWRSFIKTGNVIDPLADFNKNGRIDVQDAVFIIGEFLRLYSVYHTTPTAAGTGAAGLAAEAVIPAAGAAPASIDEAGGE